MVGGVWGDLGPQLRTILVRRFGADALAGSSTGYGITAAINAGIREAFPHGNEDVLAPPFLHFFHQVGVVHRYLSRSRSFSRSSANSLEIVIVLAPFKKRGTDY